MAENRTDGLVWRQAFSAALLSCLVAFSASAQDTGVVAMDGSDMVSVETLPPMEGGATDFSDVPVDMVPNGTEMPGMAPPAAGAEMPSAEADLGWQETQDDGVVGLIEAPEGQPMRGAVSDVDPMLPADDPLWGVENQMFADTPSSARASAQGMARQIGPHEHPPVVVELFTSQGCSSCPPADDLLGELAANPDILALSWHVDYWDYLGWADEFARPEFTQRQKDYARAVGERSIYTPQVIVGGSDTLISMRPAELMSIVQTHMAQPVAVSVNAKRSNNGYQLDLMPRAPARRDIAILLVRYVPKREAAIRDGENRGLAMVYTNVVVAVDPVARWDGKVPLRLTVRLGEGGRDGEFPADTKHAILAQQLGAGRNAQPTGPILAAFRLD